MNVIIINNDIKIPYSDLNFDFFRSSGPGGQHVNKVETGVRLRFYVVKSPYISDIIKNNILSLYSNKINRNGELLIESSSHKSQHQNKITVINKFKDILIHGSKKEKIRIKTRPTRSSVEKRISQKKKRSNVKKLRKKPVRDDS